MNNIPPIDTNGQPASALDLLFSIAGEAARGKQNKFRGDALADAKRRTERINLLLRATHTTGSVVLPIPQMVVYQQIMTLRERLNLNVESPAPSAIQQWVIESCWMLSVQTGLEEYYLEGAERQRAIHRFWHNIPATRFAEYYIALMDILDMLEKKSQTFSMTMMNDLQSLIRQRTSSSSAKPSDGPSASSPDPAPEA